MKSNYHELGGFIDFAKKYKFDRLQITPVDIKNTENIFLNNDWEALDFIDRSIPDIFDKAKSYGIRVSNWLPEIEKPGLNQKSSSLSDCPSYNTIDNSNCEPHNRIACYWPWQFLFIDWGGRVRPQCFCREPIGNIHHNSIAEIWNGQIMQGYRQRLFDNNFKEWCDSRCVSGKMPKESLSLDFNCFDESCYVKK